MGKVAAERCEKVMKKGKPGDTHYVTVAPMLSWKLTLLNKNRQGLVYRRSAHPDTEERFLARKMIHVKKTLAIPDYMRPSPHRTNDLTKPTQDMIDKWEQTKKGNHKMEGKTGKKGNHGEKKDQKNSFKKAVKGKAKEKLSMKGKDAGKDDVKEMKSKKWKLWKWSWLMTDTCRSLWSCI